MTTANILSQLGSPGVSTGFKNRIINGAMVIDQRAAGASVTPTTTGNYNYQTVDRWANIISQASKFTIGQNLNSVTPPAGFTNYLGIQVAASPATVGSGDYFQIAQNIEGFNSADLNWGSGNAKTVTLSFWVYSSLTGTFGGAIGNNAGYNYVFSYSIPTANTWTQISITVVGPTAGTWAGATNGLGINLRFSLGMGSTYTSTAGSWQANYYFAPTGSVNLVATANATFYITGVQLEVGTTATNFEVRDYGRELILCQRYLFAIRGSLASTSGQGAIGVGTWDGGTGAGIIIPFAVQMRSAPSSITVSSAGDFQVVREAVAWETVTSITLSTDTIGITACSIATATATRDTRGYAARMRTNSTNAYLGFNAEL